MGRWHSRVSGYPEVASELPTALLPEEIETPGKGQIRAMVTIAGNPVLSAPDGDRLSAGLDQLDFMVSVDPYLNETTRHADVILPRHRRPTTPHFDVPAVRACGAHQRPVLTAGVPLPEGRPDDRWRSCAA